MGMINSANWTWPGFSQDLITALSDTANVSPDVRALYVVGNLLPYLQGDTFNEALTWFNQSAPLFLETVLKGSQQETAAREAINTAANLAASRPASEWYSSTPGLLGSIQQRQQAMGALKNALNQMQVMPGGTAGSAAYDPWGGEMLWLRSMVNQLSGIPKTAAEWANYNDTVKDVFTPTASEHGTGYSTILRWFANPSYNAPTVAAAPGRGYRTGARSWWGS
jgi:hypothetical protein